MKLLLPVLFCLVGCGGVMAATLPPTLRACVGIADDKVRLACLDREIALLENASVHNPAATVVLTPEQKLGLPQKRVEQIEAPVGAPAPATVKGLEAHIAKASGDAAGHAVVELDNGQVWQQIDSQSGFSPRSGDLAKISKGAMGSFWLSLDSRRAARVKRVR